MCSLNQSFSSPWSRSHALSEIAGKYAFTDVNTFSNSHFLYEILGNEVILEGQYCAAQLWLQFIINSVEIIFRPYYFVKLFGSIT